MRRVVSWLILGCVAWFWSGCATKILEDKESSSLLKTVALPFAIVELYAEVVGTAAVAIASPPVAAVGDSVKSMGSGVSLVEEEERVRDRGVKEFSKGFFTTSCVPLPLTPNRRCIEHDARYEEGKITYSGSLLSVEEKERIEKNFAFYCEANSGRRENPSQYTLEEKIRYYRSRALQKLSPDPLRLKRLSASSSNAWICIKEGDILFRKEGETLWY